MKDKILGLIKDFAGEGDVLAKFGLTPDVDASADAAPILAIIEDTLKVVDTQLSDGFQWTDLLPIAGAIIGDLAEAIDHVEDATDDEKVEFVTACAWACYVTIDRGPEGDKNRIDIPLVPARWETSIEKKVVKEVVALAARAAIERTRPALRDSEADTKELEGPELD